MNASRKNTNLPNIVLIYADDLGMGMLGCYGQLKVLTPNIDSLAEKGTKFTRCYGTAFCAPARAALICGIHDAHAGRWSFNKAFVISENNYEQFDEIFESINNNGFKQEAGYDYLAAVAKKAGYYTGQIGKLEWGFTTTAEELDLHGWDYHYGYYDHGNCHGFYPPYLFENGEMLKIEENTCERFGAGLYKAYEELTDGYEYDMSGRVVYSQDLFDEKIEGFFETHKNEPFLLYHPTQLPHGPTFYPEIHPSLKDRTDMNRAAKEYGSMVIRLDETVGKITKKLEELDLIGNTVIIFTADNGHTAWGYMNPECALDGTKVDNINVAFRTDTCGDVYNGNAGMAGEKTTNWDGGARLPHIVRWDGAVPAGKTTDRLSSNYDIVSLVADIGGVAISGKDGISYLDALKEIPGAPEHDYIIYCSFMGPAIVTKEGYKLRTYLSAKACGNYGGFGARWDEFTQANKDEVIFQLYDVIKDPAEKENLAEVMPEKVTELLKILVKECDGNLLHGTPQAHFAFNIL
jgi:arylsulfatase A-like enzyme